MSTRPLLIRDGTVITGTGKPPVRSDILVLDGRIVEVGAGQTLVGPDRQIIDASGKFVVPGFIDMHAHLISGGFDTISEVGMTYDFELGRRLLKQMLYWGVTSVYSPVQPIELGRDLRQEAAKSVAPRLFISGPGFTAPGGWAGANDPTARREPTTAAEVEKCLDELARAQVDIVKIFYDDMSCAFTRSMPQMSKPVMEAIVSASHHRGLKVMVHAYDNRNHKETMGSGADIMAHSAVTAPVDDEYIALARQNRVMYLGTLSIYYDSFDQVSIRQLIQSEHVTTSVPQTTLRTLDEGGPLDHFETMIRQSYIKQQLPVIADNMHKVWKAGIAIGVGPDTGVMGAFPGFAVHREMQLMVQAGLPTSAVLDAATSSAAQCLGQPDLGTLAPGKVADMVVLGGNPLEDIHNTRDIHAVVRAGTIVDRERLRSDVFAVDAARTAPCC